MDKLKILEALKLIKQAFVSEQKFVDEKLNDNTTIIRYDAEDLAVGVPVMVVTDAGAIAIPDGDYTTADGDTFTTVGGIVTVATMVDPAQEAPQTSAPAPAQGMTEAQAKSIIESVIKESRFMSEAEFTTKVSELGTELEGKFSVEWKKAFIELKDAHEALQNQFKAALDLFEKFAELPSGVPAEPKKGSFNMAEFKKNFKEDLNNIKN